MFSKTLVYVRFWSVLCDVEGNRRPNTPHSQPKAHESRVLTLECPFAGHWPSEELRRSSPSPSETYGPISDPEESRPPWVPDTSGLPTRPQGPGVYHRIVGPLCLPSREWRQGAHTKLRILQTLLRVVSETGKGDLEIVNSSKKVSGSYWCKTLVFWQRDLARDITSTCTLGTFKD